jgi:hypothetical protein
MAMNQRLMRPELTSSALPPFALVTVDGDLLVTASREPLLAHPVRVLESYSRWAFHGVNGSKFLSSNQYLQDVYVSVSTFGPTPSTLIDENATYFQWSEREARGMLHWIDAGYGLGPVGYADTITDLLHEMGYSQATFIPGPPTPGVGRVRLTGNMARGTHPDGHGFRVVIREHGLPGQWDSALFYLEAVSDGGILSIADAIQNAAGMSTIEMIGLAESFLYLGYDGIAAAGLDPHLWIEA